jgi:tol-pal system protein YbgF
MIKTNIVRALRWALPLAMSFLLAGGCASRKEIVGFQEDTRVMRAELDSIKDQQALMLEAMSSMDSDLNEMRARTENGSITTDERLQQLAAQLDDILTRMDRSLAPLEELVRKEKEAESDSTGRTGMGIDIFDAAMQDLSQGNYDLAETGFLQFLQENPSSGLADAARYGLGESFYARGRFLDASAEYERVIENGAESKKTPAALLKLGLCYKELDRTEESSVARQRLEDLRGE